MLYNVENNYGYESGTMKVALGGLMVTVLAIGPRFAGSNPTEGDGFFRTIKICNKPAFGGEVKPSAQCCRILRHVKEPYEYERDIS
jgi:hypothetical protein